MKVISRKDFQDAYISPTEEQAARMQAKLDSLQQEQEERRHVLLAKPRLAFVIAAVLIIAGITAIATNTTRYQTTWGGEVKEYEQSVHDEKVDAFYDGVPDDMQAMIDNALEEGLFPVLTGSQGGFSTFPSEYVSSEKELIAMLDAEGFPHPEALLPEGYQFAGANVSYDVFSSSEMKLVNGMTEGAYSVKLYSVEPENKYIHGYTISFKDKKDPEKYNMLSVTTAHVSGFTAYFDTDGKVETKTLSVPGMEDAFKIHTNEIDTLYMCRNIANNAVFRNGKMSKIDIRYLIIRANGEAIDDVIKLYSAWED